MDVLEFFAQRCHPAILSEIVADAEPLPAWTQQVLAELAAETISIGGAAGPMAVVEP